MNDAGFPIANEMWIPKLVDILVRRTKAPTDEEKAYYAKFGLDKLDWNDSTYTSLSAYKDEIVQYFEERYLDRMINSETLEMWQVRLQRRFDELAPKYDRALSLYGQYDIDSVEQKLVTTYNNVKDERGGVDKTVSIDSDTPDVEYNASHQYADAVRTTEDSGNRSSTRTGSVELETDPAGGKLLNVNENIEAFRALVVEFVAGFENNFLNVFWY